MDAQDKPENVQVKSENAPVDVPVKLKNAPVNENGEDTLLEEKVLQFYAESKVVYCD